MKICIKCLFNITAMQTSSTTVMSSKARYVDGKSGGYIITGVCPSVTSALHGGYEGRGYIIAGVCPSVC